MAVTQTQGPLRGAAVAVIPATGRARPSDDGANAEALAVTLVDQTGNPVSAGGGSSTLPAGTDRSGTITTSGTAQQLAPANPSRAFLKGQNISAADLWLNEIGGTAAPNVAGSYRVASGGTFGVNTNRAISIYGATTGQAFSATEG